MIPSKQCTHGEFMRMRSLQVRANAMGYGLSRTASEAERYQLKRYRNVICTFADLDTLAEWLDAP